MKKAVYGAQTDHPDIAASYNNIGNAYDCLGQWFLTRGEFPTRGEFEKFKGGDSYSSF